MKTCRFVIPWPVIFGEFERAFLRYNAALRGYVSSVRSVKPAPATEFLLQRMLKARWLRRYEAAAGCNGYIEWSYAGAALAFRLCAWNDLLAVSDNPDYGLILYAATRKLRLDLRSVAGRTSEFLGLLAKGGFTTVKSGSPAVANWTMEGIVLRQDLMAMLEHLQIARCPECVYVLFRIADKLRPCRRRSLRVPILRHLFKTHGA